MVSLVSLVLFCLGYYLLAALVISIGYHRVLSHRAVSLVGWLEKSMITIGLAAGTPVQWAGNHRCHHRYTDVEGDPHSPVLNGFWHAHCGWYIGTTNPWICFLYAIAGPFRTLFDAFWRPLTNQQYNHLAKDIQQIRYYAWISKPLPYAAIILTHMGLLLSFMWLVWGSAGWIAIYITYVLIYTVGDATDSIAHLYGKRAGGESKHQARNNWFVAVLGAGEWHANHHSHPSSANMALQRGQFDLSWQVIRLLAYAGLAEKVNSQNQNLTDTTDA